MAYVIPLVVKVEEKNQLLYGVMDNENTLIPFHMTSELAIRIVYSINKAAELAKDRKKLAKDSVNVEKIIHKEVYEEFTPSFRSIELEPCPESWRDLER